MLQDRLAEQAKRLQESGTKESDTVGEQALRKEFENLSALLQMGQGINHDDVKVIKVCNMA